MYYSTRRTEHTLDLRTKLKAIWLAMAAMTTVMMPTKARNVWMVFAIAWTGAVNMLSSKRMV